MIINLRRDDYPQPGIWDNEFITYNIPVVDKTAATIDQITTFFEIYDKHSAKYEPILIHCLAGCGRTGLMLAAWILRQQEQENMKDAIAYLRQHRPCSVENSTQQDFLLDNEELIRTL